MTKAVRRTFGTVPAEVPVTRDVHVLAPRFRSALERVLVTMRGLGHDPLVVETLRTSDRQRFLYGFGRDYDDGRGVVTYSSDADETWHGYGLAADVVCAGKYWNATKAFWDALGRACEREGLEWGGTWAFVDKPHIQWGKPMRRSPSPRAGRLLAAGGPPAVWREVGAI
jgi:hypothetical protein